MKLIGVGLLVCALASAPPQQTTIPIADASRTGSPVRFFGTVTAEDEGSGVLRYSLKRNISFTNVSSNYILLIVAKTDITRLTKVDLHETHVDDYFFTLDVLDPNASKIWNETDGPFGEPNQKGELEPEEPRAIVKAVFVQFADGSTWGDSAAGKDALRDRQLTADKLRILGRIYRTEGNRQFVAELTKASELSAILYLQGLYAQSKDAETVIRKVDSMLNAVELHQPALHPDGAQR